MSKSLGYLLLTLVLISCGPKSGYFRIEGRIKNLNQGEFYIYSPDGGMVGVDTIGVNKGKFSYETPLENKATFVMIFPNFSEQPIFGESGTEVRMEADASRLREMEITGTDDNETMTAFRLKTNSLSPGKAQAAADSFITANPASIVSTYLLRRYFIDIANPDYQKAWELSGKIAAADKENVRMVMLNKELNLLRAAPVGSDIPSFSATDLEGESVGRKDLRAEVNVVYLWSTWNRDSQGLQKELRKQKTKYKDRLAVLSICLDASDKHCAKFLKRDSAMWSTVCDGLMWQSPVVETLGMATLPGNIVTDKEGKIIARNLSIEEMKKKLGELLD